MKNIHIKTIFLIISFLAINYMATAPKAYGEAYGTALGSFNGVMSYSNGSTTTYIPSNSSYINNVYLGVKWQCVEYVRRYYYQIYGMDLYSKHQGNANTWYANSSTMGLVRYRNGESSTPPQVGDILTSNSGGYGHIGIVKSVTSTNVCTIQQNFTNTATDTNLCKSLTNYNGYYTVGGFSSGYPVYGWLRKPGATSGWVSVSNLSVSPSTVTIGKNFDISFTLKELNGAAKTFENIAVAILDSSGNFLFDAKKYDTSVTIQANKTWSQTITTSLYASRPEGTYKVIVRGMLGGKWFDFDTTDNAHNPSNFNAGIQETTGWVSVSSLSVSPSTVVIGQNFNINFTLREVNGASKTLEKVAVAILDGTGTYLYDANIYNTTIIPANGALSKTVTTYLRTSRPAGTYQVIIRGMLGGNWFDFDTTGSGRNPSSFYAGTQAAAHIPGDLNNDGIVNYLDYGILHNNYGKTNCGNVADINGDCTVNYLDYGILHQNYGQGE